MNETERDWMLACDVAGCSSMFAAHEDLRGLEWRGKAEARRRANAEGWTCTEDEYRCPRHEVERLRRIVKRRTNQRDSARALAEAADARVENALSIHFERRSQHRDTPSWCADDGYLWPCPTARALGTALDNPSRPIPTPTLPDPGKSMKQ